MGSLRRGKNDDLVEKIDRMIAEGIANCQDKHKRCQENQQYTRGLQWAKADILRQTKRGRPAIPWNDTFKVVHAISNREMVERFIPKVFGREVEDGGIANVLDEACRWQRQLASSEQYESMGFRSAAMGGYGCVHKYWDPTAMDGSGQIRDEDVPIWEMLWPSRSREMNLSDRLWHVRGKWVSADAAEAMYGSSSRALRRKFKGIRESLPSDPMQPSAANVGSNNPSGAGFGWIVAKANKWQSLATKEVFVAEAEWKEVEYFFRAAVPEGFDQWYSFVVGMVPLQVPAGEADPESGQQPTQPLDYSQYQALDPDQQDQIKKAVLGETEIIHMDSRAELNDFMERYLDLMGEEFKLFHQAAKTVVKYAVRIDTEIADYGIRDWGYSYHFITGFPFETSEGADFFGVVDIIKGPQDYKNALISNMLAMYMSSPKGAMAIAKSVGNVQDIADRMASPSALIQLPDDVMQAWDQKIKSLGQPSYPPMLDPLMSLASSGVEQALGLQSIDLGTQGDLRRISGTVVQSARTASNVIVAILFDSLRMFRRQYGLCNVRFINRMYTLEEIERIVGQSKDEDVQSIDPTKWDDIIKFDIVIDEQPSTPSEQMELINMLTTTGMLESWRAAGEITFEDILKMLPTVPESVKRSILKNRGIMQQMQQMQQQVQQSQQMTQSFYQFLQQASPELLQQWTQMWQQQQVSQQIFSAPGAQQGPGQPPPSQPVAGQRPATAQ